MLVWTMALAAAAMIGSATTNIAGPTGVNGVLGQPFAEGPEQVTKISANRGFDRWITGFKARALAKGISATTFDRAFDGVDYDAQVIERDRNQSEFTKALWDYLDSAVSADRVANGKAALKNHRRLLDRIEAKFGVDKEIVVAIWGLESAYGQVRGDSPLIASLATLAYDGRRGAFFESQLVAALEIIFRLLA